MESHEIGGVFESVNGLNMLNNTTWRCVHRSWLYCLLPCKGSQIKLQYKYLFC